MRYDPFGSGVSDEGKDVGTYWSAFPMAEPGMGCPFGTCGGYELTSDLDFRDRGSYASGTVNSKWIGGVGWLPVGIGEERFSAKFNGNGYTITNLYISRTGLADPGATGLFGKTSESSEISHVRLLETEVSGGNAVGGLVGISGGAIRAVYVGGTVSGISEVGGLAGRSFGDIVDSSVNMAVSGEHKTGGLAGTGVGRIADSYATGSVSGQSLVGGLLGNNSDSGVIVRSYFTGNLTGASVLGGIAGRNDGEIIASYSTGRVSGSSEDRGESVGGLVGGNQGSIMSSYSVAQVGGSNETGGLVGVNDGIITSSYSAGDVSGQFIAGGLTGSNRGMIRAAYATGDVSGVFGIGGLSGDNWDDSSIITSYAIGRVVREHGGGNAAGGLVGVNLLRGMIFDSYWDTQSTRQQRGAGDGRASGATGATTAQLQRPTGYAGIYGTWHVDIDNADGDFDPATGRDDLWDFGSSRQYPALRVDFDGDGVASWREFGDQRLN